MTLLSLTHNTEEMGALYYFITFDPSNKAGSFKLLNMRKHIGISNRAMTNQHFTLTLVNYLVITTCISWLLCLLLQAGDVHPNTGPSSTVSPGFNYWFSSAPVFQWCCSTPQGSPGVGRNTFLSSPHLCFIIVFISDLFVSRDDPLMS